MHDQVSATVAPSPNTELTRGVRMDAILNEHEVIKFLTNRGGRCTNFELVSNFKSVLNDPRYQAAARLKFKDIINTVATVGEFQNVKYIEIKKEFIINNDVFQPEIQNRSEPTSLSSEGSRGSYSSPFTNEFQPYWRFRLATTTKVPSLPPRNPELEAILKPPGNNVVSSRPTSINRSVSETTLSQNPNLRPMHRIPSYVGATANENRRSSTDNTRYQHVVGNRFEENENSGNQYGGNNVRRSSGNFTPDRMLNNYTSDTYRVSQSLPYNNPGLNRSVSEYPPVWVERRFSASGYPGENTQRLSYHASSDFQRASADYDGGYNRTNYERKPEVYRDGYHSDTNKDSRENSRAFDETSVSRKIETMHGIHRRASNDSGYLTTPFDSPNENRSMKNSPSRRIEVDFEEDESDIHTSANLRNVSRALFRDSNAPVKAVRPSPNNIENEFTGDSRKHIGSTPLVHADTRIQEIMPSSPNRRALPNTHSSPSLVPSREDTRKHSISDHIAIPKRNSTGDLSGKALSTRSSEASSDGSMLSLNSEQDFDSSKFKVTVPHSKLPTDPNEIKSLITTKENNQPLPPVRRRKHQDKAPSEEDTKENTDPPNRELSMASGKVRDRVQHFDDMEKKRNVKRSHSPLTPDKENRIHSKGIGTDDDVSISVLDSKLKREWFVKAAQCDYHALVALLKKEPKLAAIKDSAMGYTALHWAAKHGDANVIKLIAGAYKVNPNIRSNGGYTPVHIASLHKHDMIVHLLVHTYGADASLRDYSGKRADQYPDNYVRVVAGHKTLERRPLKQRPPEKETPTTTSNSFMRFGSMNLRKARKSTVFASVRGGSRNRNSLGELRFGNHASIRKKLHKSMPPIEKKSEMDKKNDSDSDSNYGFPSKKQES